MNAIRYRLRAELRVRWRAWLALALLIGTLCGGAIAVVAGGRRINTVVSRTLAATKPPEIFMVPEYTINGELLDFDAISAFPEVVEAIRLPLLGTIEPAQPVLWAGRSDMFDGASWEVVAGAVPLPEEPSAVVIDVRARDQLGLRVGDQITYRFLRAPVDVLSDPEEGPAFTFRVAAIVTALGNTEAMREPGVLVTPAFEGAYGSAIHHAERTQFALGSRPFDLPRLDILREGQPDPSIATEALLDPSRSRVLAGVMPSPDDPTAAVINVLARDELGLRVGDEITYRFAAAHADPGAEPRDGPVFTFRIAAIAATIGDMGGNAEPSALLTPAFGRASGSQVMRFDLLMFRLGRSFDDSEAFHRHIGELTGGKPVYYIEGSSLYEQVRRSFGLQGVTVLLLGGFIGLTALLVMGQLLARLTSTESSDHETLQSVGFSARALALLSWARLAIVLVIAWASCIGVAVALSPLFPFGRSSIIEPEPGPSFDGTVVGLGLVAMAVFAIAISAVPVWRASRPTAARVHARVRPARAATISRFNRLPWLGMGTRLALEPGQGTTAVPVRSALTSSALGITAVIAALVVGSSLANLRVTPRLYGWNWDVIVSSDGSDFTPGAPDAQTLRSIPGIGTFSVGAGGEGGSIVVDGKEIAATALTTEGGVAPPVLDGILPTSPDEIALGANTLRQIGRQVGDVVEVSFAGIELRRSFTISGTVVLPFTRDDTALGEGAFLTLEGGRRLFADVPADVAFVRFTPDADRAQAMEALKAAFDDVATAQPPERILDFGQVANMPLIAAGVVGLMSGATLAHVLTSSIRRRRRDLGILRALGFERGQIGAMIGVMATVQILISLAIGVPAGIVAGRWLWAVIADLNGFVAVPLARPLVMLATSGGAVLLANLIAVWPARAAARTKPALALRSE